MNDTQKVISIVPLQHTGPSVINEGRLEEALLRLYREISQSRMIYSSVRIETHAVQRIYRPKSPAFKQRYSDELVKRGHTPKGQLTLPFEGFKPKREVLRRLDPNTKEYRMFLFLACLTDRREGSINVYFAHCMIYQDYPWLYTESVLRLKQNDLKEIFSERVTHTKGKKKRTSHRVLKYKIGSAKDSAKYWIPCAKTIFEEFGGDPERFFRDVGWSVASVLAWKDRETRKRGRDPIPGFGPKLISLYFFYLAELGFTPLPEDVFAADIQAQSITYQVGALQFGERDKISTATFAEALRLAVSRLIQKHNLDLILLAHSTYFLGSHLCRVCYKTPNIRDLCPIYDMCSGRVDTSSYNASGVWRNGGAQVMLKGDQVRQFGLPASVRPREKRRREEYVPKETLFSRITY